MVRVIIRAGLLFVAAVVGVSCTARPPHPPATATSAQPSISLRGFLGDKTFISIVRELLPPRYTGSPLPDGWMRDIPAQSYGELHSLLYIDEHQGGKDDDLQYGIENSTLTFYAGHGLDIDGWYVPPDDDVVPLQIVRVGDHSIRYFWLYSCRVLAHGPKVAAAGDDYAAPQCFQPGKGHADVFYKKRWGGAMRPDFRMVCGGSTDLGSGVGEIWSYLLEAQTSVADAWILGLANPEQVPVCLARGGEDQDSSALSDRTLHTEAVAQGGRLHLQYPVRCKVARDGSTLHVSCNKPTACGASSEPLAPGPGSPSATEVPLATTTHLKAPAVTAADLPLGFVQLAGNAGWKYHPDSGAVVLTKSRDQYSQPIPCDKETEWTVQPSVLLARTGLDLKILASESAPLGAGRRLADFTFTALEMRVESRPDGAASGSCAVRSLFLLLHSKVDVGPPDHSKSYPVFGPAVAFELQRQGNEEPVLASFSAPRRNLTVAPDKKESLKTESMVINEAHEALQLNAEEYPVERARATFGYEEAPLRCLQSLLRPTYEIQFFPSPEAAHERPTIIVRRDARLDPHDESWECRGWGAFPPP